MPGWRTIASSAALLAACALPAPAPPPAEPAGPAPAPATLLIRGASVMTAAGPTLHGADVLVRGERIAGVGQGLEAPAGTPVIEGAGLWLTPGLIDPHSHMGVYALPMVGAHADGNETGTPFTPDVRAIDSFWPQDPALERALAGGVTAIHVLPGSANIIGGQGVTLRLRPALSAERMRLPGAPGTMKLACGENPKRMHGGMRRSRPQTRMGEVAMLRQELAEAAAHDPDAADVPDHAADALARVVSGELLVQNHCYRADEMLLRLELFAEHEIRPRAFHHAVEAYKIADELAAAGVGAVVWADWWGVKMELLDAVFAGAALLDRAGVRVALHSDSPFDVQRMNQQAALAMAAGRRAGLDVGPDDAIRWITANAAWVLGIEDQVGTIEAGKRADLVLWSADPLSVYARARRVWIDGREVYARGDGAEPHSDFELGRRLPR